ncbi:MAG: tetratricopeptide repeat protein [Myxococcales bacterium]|nr:tetratricopeptide repeat protein [Myxococcales bacterium]
MRHPLRALCCAALVAFGASNLAACAHAPERGVSNSERAQRELDLAASLRREGNVPSALMHTRQAIELDPDYPEAHLLLGFIQLEREDYPTAEDELRRGVDLLVAQKRQGSTLAEARNMLGLALIERKKYDEAVKVLQQSATDEMNTAPHLAWGNVGEAYLRAGNPQAAVAPLLESVRVQPRFCLGYYRLGQAYFRLGRYGLAEQALIRATDADKSCRDNPMLQGAWRLRGETRIHLGHRDDAIHDLTRCIELAPKTDDARACQVLLDKVS